MSKILINCKKCNIEFLKCKSQIKRTKNHFCSNKCSLNFNSKISTPHLKNVRITTYNLNPNKCVHCGINLEYSKKNNKFCTKRCAAIENQKNGGHSKWTDDGKKRLSMWAKKHAFIPNPKNRIKKICDTCKKEFEVVPSQKSKNCCSRKCKYEHIKVNGLLKGKRGGYREKGGRGKQGWYKGYYCNSSWELAWVIFNLEHNIKFKRNTEGFPYKFNNNNYNFYPDFILESTNEYFEIKGYLDNKNKAKINSFPFNLNVIDKYKIKMYIDYVTSKYGKDFINLYEK
jgi:endogenous inhibitor of DNA gyrase (YacG/DUF329 family)